VFPAGRGCRGGYIGQQRPSSPVRISMSKPAAALASTVIGSAPRSRRSGRSSSGSRGPKRSVDGSGARPMLTRLSATLSTGESGRTGLGHAARPLEHLSEHAHVDTARVAGPACWLGACQRVDHA
jgi:hypothetical protein